MKCAHKNCSKKGHTNFTLEGWNKDKKTLTIRKKYCTKHASRAIRELSDELKKGKE